MAPNKQHYGWAAGHFLMVLCATRYILTWVTFKSGKYSWWYNFAFAGALLSYGIVVYKSLGAPKEGVQTWIVRALADENFQYLCLALFWFTTKPPVPLALVPYLTFSAFHVATFIRTTVIPMVFPPTPGPNGQLQSHSFAKTIQVFVKTYYDPSMKLVAYVELGIFFRVLLGVLLLQNSLFTPIAYGIFLRQRYFHSLFTRQAFAKFDETLKNILHGPHVQGTFPAAPAWYEMFKTYLSKLTFTVIEPAPVPGSAGTSGTKKTL